MPTPTLTIRIDPAHHSLIRRVVARLKTDPGFCTTLSYTLSDSPMPPATPAPAPGADLAAILARLDDIVARLPPATAGRVERIDSLIKLVDEAVLAAGTQRAVARAVDDAGFSPSLLSALKKQRRIADHWVPKLEDACRRILESKPRR